MASALAHTEESHRFEKSCQYPGCEARGTGQEFPTDDYCSEACKHRDAGRELLAEIIYNHKYCGTCGTLLKTVYRPERGKGVANPKDFYTRPPERFIGYQSRTPDATTGEKERPHDPGRVPRPIGTGTICGVCGATHTSDPVPWRENPRLLEACGRFADALEREDVASVNLDRVFSVVIDTGDVELAFGRGVEA